MQFTVEDIISFCGQGSYKKGHSCASLDSFIKIFVQDNVLFGLYGGSVGTYRINILFRNNTPQEAWCTCPAMGVWDDKCKHVAGLMLLWQKHARHFTVLDSWHALLSHYDKESLMALITRVASGSLDVTSELYAGIKGEPLIEEDDEYDPDDEW